MAANKGLGYVEIGTSDVARSLDFYRDLLGFSPAEEPAPVARSGVHWLSAGSTLLALVETGADGDLGGWVRDDLQRGMRHVGFKVGDVTQQAERLRDAGVTFTIEPTKAAGEVQIAFFTDPDGTMLEIIDGHLRYHKTWSKELAKREAAAAKARPRDAGPVFDHVAVTVADIDNALRFYRDVLGYAVIGQLDPNGDSRGCAIHYLQAGPAVLEVFTFSSAETSPSPWTPEAARVGLRGVGLAAPSPAMAAANAVAEGGSVVAPARDAGPVVGAVHVLDADGVPLQLTGGL